MQKKSRWLRNELPLLWNVNGYQSNTLPPLAKILAKNEGNLVGDFRKI